ncbi:hypothetical protein HER32_06695 [Hymenobacter sp. BT18]|uniref:hypothetical protein n=1 Tax=Hymenobacter sp. BT18 TaxID=2835648 RepID=UPI00143EE474|nr:hypothetical protein [Hymenobacter sp. BT18]QIX60881.1 hypothetical protein HER32_06695 [Hymenobacter sp. BT18]
MATTPNQLRPEVAEKYSCTIVPTLVISQRLGRNIDLTQLTLEQADELVQDSRFTYLVLKKKRPSRKKPQA